MKTRTMNFTKSLPISFRQGMSVPQYGERDKTEQTRGTINKASRARISNDNPMRSSSCFERPTIPCTTLAWSRIVRGLFELTQHGEYKADANHCDVK